MKEIVIDGVTYTLTQKEKVKEEPKLPKTWEELENIEGYYVRNNSEVFCPDKLPCIADNKNIFATKEQAEASIALAQLSQLLKVYRGDWIPDWEDDDEDKWCVYYYADKIDVDSSFREHKFLSFPTQELAKEFLNNFRDLIEKAKSLL